MNYHEYTAVDFAADDSFIKWVKKPTSPNAIFWENWLQNNPGKQEVIQEARKLVLYLLQDKDELQEGELNQIWQKLKQARTDGPEKANSNAKIFPFRFLRKTQLVAAASISVLCIAAGIFYLSNYLSKPNATVTYATGYGQRRTLLLPDSSVITLNAHSKITIPENWPLFESRKIKLTGEAYFAVRHKPDNQKFIVETPNGLQVEVLGTEFNVSDRGHNNQVILVNGSVRLQREQGLSFKPEIMSSGDLFEVSKTAAVILRKKVNPALYTAWKNNKLILDNTPLREVAFMLEQNYGFAVTFRGKGLADLKMTASLDTRNLNDILLTLSETFNLKITRHQQGITISK